MAKKILLDQIAVVTGASSGIGRATALELANAGAHLVLAARREKLLEDLSTEIKELGRDVLVEVTDITQQGQVDHLISKAISKFGRIDILVVCAGIYYRSPIDQISLSIMERSMAVNFYGGLHSILATLPHMRTRNSGHIVLVSTMDTKLGLPGDSPYAASKSALSIFVDILRQELHGSGIHTSTVLPGRVATPFIEDLVLPKISTIISSQTVARAIVNGIKKRKIEIILPFPATMLHYIRVLSPRIADWIIRVFRLQGWEVNDQAVQDQIEILNGE